LISSGGVLAQDGQTVTFPPLAKNISMVSVVPTGIAFFLANDLFLYIFLGSFK